MMSGGQRPRSVVENVRTDGFEMALDVKPPGDGPALQFWCQFRPLFFDAADVFSLMMQEQGCRLNHPLNEQDLVVGGTPSFQVVPQVFPCFVGVPELSRIKQGRTCLEQLVFFIGQWVSRPSHHARGGVLEFEPLRKVLPRRRSGSEGFMAVDLAPISASPTITPKSLDSESHSRTLQEGG